MNKKIVLFPDKLREESTTEEIFCGYIEGGLFLKDGNVRLSRSHRQPNRIYSANGIHPTISSSETQGRYFIAENEQSTGHRPLIVSPDTGSQFSILNFQKMLNVITLFSGYDSQALALNRLGIPYDLAAWCEIDRHAITAHNALFPQWKDRNLGDVSQVDWAEWHASHPQPIDLLTYSSPCQDFSSAGLQRGGEEGSGTRSGLLWETERAVRELRPRHLVFENVGGLVSDKFIDLFNRWQARLNTYGYTNFQQLMNAKDYGVPQNRLRIFMVSILDCRRAYYFPKPFKLERRLKDVLEQNVEERYYLEEEQVRTLMNATQKHQEKGNGFAFKPHTPDDDYAFTVACGGKGGKTDNFIAEPQIASMKSRDRDNPTGVRTANNGNFAQRLEPSADQSTSNTITSVAKDNLLIIPQATKEGYAVVPEGGVFDASYPDSTTRRGRVQEGGTVSPTIMASQNELLRYEGKTDSVIELPVDKAHQQDAIQHEDGISRCLVVGSHGNSAYFTNTAVSTPQGIRIRRLTERELYRLMDVEEKDIDTLLSAPIPRTQHAKLAGNSIVVACLYHIFRHLFVTTDPTPGTQTKLF